MSDQHSLASLVERAKRGDLPAFEDAIARLRPRLETLVRFQLGDGLRRHVEVHDVLQETLMRSFRSLDQFEWRGEESFFRWISGISRHVVLETAAKEKRTRAVPIEGDLLNEDPTPSKLLQRQERFDRLQKAVDALSPDQRQVVLWARVDRVPVTEIARRMGRSPNAVSHLLLRALSRLRDIFGDTESLRLPDLRLADEGIEPDE